MRGRVFRQLLHRRVPQIVGIYLAAGWGMLEFTDWAVNRLGVPPAAEAAVFTVWLVLLPLVALGAWKFGSADARAGGRRGEPRSRVGADEALERSVAVLPFSNLSADSENEFLSDGVTEEIINALTKVQGLRVVSRTSVFAYKGRSEDVRTIGEELGVGSVLEGSIQRAGNRLRVTAQLVSVSDGYHLWSARFDRGMEDVFAVEDEIAENIVRVLRVYLEDSERRVLRRAPPSDVRAYEYYLRGRKFFHQTRAKSLRFAREMFQKAIEIDPNYALAWAGIAETGALLHMYYPSSAPDLADADQASTRALELAPLLPEAHAARGLTLFQMKQLEEAERAFQTAIRLDPRQFDARYFYARACFQQGRIDDAARLFEEAAEVREDYQAAFFAAQSHEALGHQERALEAYARALEVVETHMELNPDDPRAATMRAVSHLRLGQRREGLRWAEEALNIDPEDAGVRYNVACLFALEGEVERAMDCLEQAFQAGFGARDWVRNDPDLKPLHGHPRFEAMMAAEDLEGGSPQDGPQADPGS